MDMQPKSLADEYMPAEISRDTRWFIHAITVAKDLEHRLPLMDSIKEIESLRHQAAGLAKWAEGKKENMATEWAGLGKELYNWAVRVTMMCQRRVGQLLGEMDLSKGGRPKTSPQRGEVSQPPPKPEVTLPSLGLSHQYASDAKTLASVPEKQLTAAMEEQIKESGKIAKQRLIKQVRADAKKRGQPVDEKTAEKRARWREQKVEEQSRKNRERYEVSASAAKENGPRTRTAPSDKFKKYWVKERKLLITFFDTPDLEKIGEYWWREFNTYRAQQEKTLSDYRQERDRREAAAELAKP
jgi:hypothetical protein